MIITGAGSGLGKYLHREFGGVGKTRGKDVVRSGALENRDCIIHCAFNRCERSDYLDKYVADNFLFTNQLVEFAKKSKHKLIYISSVDVYPAEPSWTIWSENDYIGIEKHKNIYALTKLMAESLVETTEDYLILRCSALLGPYMKPNSLLRMVKDRTCNLSLRSDSVLDYILYSDVARFLTHAIKNDLNGVWNVCTSQSATLEEAATLVGATPAYGYYFYDVGRINNTKIVSIDGEFYKTACDTINQFLGKESK